MTRCVGHRGAAALAPENTLAAFRAGMAAGVDAVECDVHCSRDGQLVLMHDADVSRTTDGSGSIGGMDLAELQRLNCAARFGDGTYASQRIVTLVELLALARGNCGVQIEIKVPEGVPYAGIEAQVVDALHEHGAFDAAQVICFDAATLSRIRALAPSLTLGFLASRASLPTRLQNDPAGLAAQALACGAEFLSLDRQFVAPQHRLATRERGLGLAVWTVNDPRDMQQYIREGVDAITSDRPDLLRQVLGEQTRHEIRLTEQ
ncbi:MAG TPA: glycerophosphodiester phosphodiesterase family protein [Chloroflexota bacterium]|jgi:glycerophosphoryl diester phosphodiesterase|nr:glycerophosphodiester phosphodiesterase family protein [Chloroflexota bacterium]